jgi:1,2-diacylglycerol 3-alpha-glucosyltransferase
MNVGIFTDCYLPTKNGVVTSILQLKEGLERRGHKAIVVTVDTPGYGAQDAGVYRFPSLPFNSAIQVRLGLVSQGRVDQIVQREQLDMIHTHTEFSLGWAAKCAARKMNLPLIHTAHTLYEAYRHYLVLGRLLSARMVQRWLRLFLRDYDVLVCPSTKAYSYFKSFMPEIRSVVIGNGVCNTRFRPGLLTAEERDQIRTRLDIGSSEKVIIYVGRMAREKRAWELLDALTPLLRQYPHYRVLFVGHGPAYPSMVKAARKNGLGRQVIFAGYVDWEQMPSLYSIAHVFVTASLSEVHPMTLIEASMCGLPIIARRDESYLDLVEDGCNGYLVDADSRIATRAAELLGDESQWRRFSRNGLRLSERFHMEIHVEKVEATYRQVIGGGMP